MKINESDLVYVKSDCCGCKEDYSMLNLYWRRTKHKHSLVYPMDKSQNRRDLCEVELQAITPFLLTQADLKNIMQFLRR